MHSVKNQTDRLKLFILLKWNKDYLTCTIW